MFYRKAFLFFAYIFFSGQIAIAQNLTGRWDGKLASNEFLQINIIQTGGKVCGYTYDHALGDKRSFCRAYFSGEYDNVNKTWYLTGTSFMQNSGSHVLMLLKFKMFKSGGESVMVGNLITKGDEGSSRFELRKVSDVPAMITQTMRDCVANNNPPEPDMPKASAVIKRPAARVPVKKPAVPLKKPVGPIKKPVVPLKKPAVTLKKPVGSVKKPALPVKKPTVATLPKKITLPPKAVPKKPAVIIKPAVPKKKDTVKIAVPPVVKAVLKNIPLPPETAGRKNKEIGRVIVNDKTVTLNVYDNGTVDGDTVSIFYNGRRILDRKKLSEKPITLDLILDENTNLHSIVLFAHNLGSIPPNTALVVLTTPSRKRFELFSSATLQQNAEIVFEYVPKE